MRCVFLTDVHFGTPRVPPARLHANLEQFLYPQLTADTTFLFLGGDLFDSDLNMDSRAALFAVTFKLEMQYLAHKYGILVRGIRGTFSHDRNQNDHLILMGGAMPTVNGHDLIKIHNQMAVESFPELGCNVLFIPADLPYNNMFDTARKLLDDRGIDRADICIHHGYFAHLLPPNMPHAPKNTYTAKEFERLVSGPVLNGHVHTASVYRNVINGGSFDRSCHGEEEAKGFFVIDWQPGDGKHTYQFIRNTNATRFLTWDFSAVDTTEAGIHLLFEKLAPLAASPDRPVFLRILTDNLELKHALREAVRQHPDVTLTVNSVSDPTVPDVELNLGKLDLPTPTRESVLVEIAAALGGTAAPSPEQLARMLGWAG